MEREVVDRDSGSGDPREERASEVRTRSEEPNMVDDRDRGNEDEVRR